MRAFLIGCFVLFVFVAPCLAQNLTADNLESFDLVWQTVNKKHFDPTFSGIDWKAMHDRYNPQIVSSNGIEEFNRITNRMLFELGLSHLLVATEDMLKTYMPAIFSEGTRNLRCPGYFIDYRRGPDRLWPHGHPVCLRTIRGTRHALPGQIPGRRNSDGRGALQ